jgi:hypothetical protein
MEHDAERGAEAPGLAGEAPEPRESVGPGVTGGSHEVGAPASAEAETAVPTEAAAPGEVGKPAETPVSYRAGAEMADPPETGEPRVDAALRRLRELDSVPVSEHPEIFERIHGQLVEVLGELHSGADPAEPSRAPGQGGPAGRPAPPGQLR